MSLECNKTLHVLIPSLFHPFPSIISRIYLRLEHYDNFIDQWALLTKGEIQRWKCTAFEKQRHQARFASIK